MREHAWVHMHSGSIQAPLQALQSGKAQVPYKYVYMAYAHLYII